MPATSTRNAITLPLCGYCASSSAERPWLALYAPGQPADVDVEYDTAPAMFAATVARNPGGDAIRYFDGRISFAELDALGEWVATLGGSVVATLPLLPAFLDELFNPSPYAPASRLFWNELFLDVEGLPELIATPDYAPDFGPAHIHPSAGAVVVGARPFLIAYNINLESQDIALAKEIAKIKRLEATPADQVPGGERKKNLRLTSLRKYLEKLKILVDINDPLVKRRFEDGFGE